jgi:hypothetical protein
MYHFIEIEKDTVLQVSGTGPSGRRAEVTPSLDDKVCAAEKCRRKF